MTFFHELFCVCVCVSVQFRATKTFIRPQTRLTNTCNKPISLCVNWEPKTGFASSVSVWPRDFLSASALRSAAVECSSTFLWVFFFLSGNSGSDSTVTETLTDQNQRSALTAFCPERSQDHWGRRCWGEGLLMPRRRSRCRRKRWGFSFFVLNCFGRWGSCKVVCVLTAQCELLYLQISSNCDCVEVSVSHSKQWMFVLQLYIQLSLCVHLFFNTGCLLKLVQTSVVKLNKPTCTNPQNLELSKSFMFKTEHFLSV